MLKNRLPIVNLLSGLAIAIILFTTWHVSSSSKNIFDAITTGQSSKGTAKYAYATYLSADAPMDPKFENPYLMSTRMLIYQLLHDPVTRAKSNIDFVVLVNRDIPEDVSKLLEMDGAIVTKVAPLNETGADLSWIVPGRPRWTNVVDKIRIFEQIQYEKILLLDNDMIVVKNLEGVFEDPATALATTLTNTSNIKDDEPRQPEHYIMAANSGPKAPTWPERGERNGVNLNAGFVILKPSIDMFNHYIGVLSIEGRTLGSAPENQLWEYVHRPDGNMPWKQIDPLWTVNSPTFEDYKHGVASFHEKYWRCCKDDRPLGEIFQQSRYKTEGYFNRMHEVSR